MDEDKKNNEQNMQGNPPAEKKSEKKKTDSVYRLYKKESHKDNKCILKGIDAEVLNSFNKGEIITVSNEQIKIIGCEVNAAGEITRVPYRWLGVE